MSDIIKTLETELLYVGNSPTTRKAFQAALGEIRRLRETQDEALGIIYDLLGLEVGSGERAMKFIDDHSPTAADVKGILPLPSPQRAENNEQERQ